MTNFEIGLQVTLYGMLGVFTVLILFYLLTKAMMIVATKVDKK